ncbi:complement C1q tumor necrosis factor-related protein 4-like [Dunckerocampus dactyliophorus]|uniref:complement C1q tumor necrosis factor-related protein 4-like n=1 Tax=Dunckerocampus dactyliophorus TaxID=161453 RepID=UPI002404FB81|nr:complement C1q tumor necrosis factor-related protein 4-like [Dunckerocampus dactyliophorus]
MQRKVDIPGKKPQKTFIRLVATILLTFIFGLLFIGMASALPNLQNQTEPVDQQDAAEAPITEDPQTLKAHVDKLVVVSVSGGDLSVSGGDTRKSENLVLDEVYVNAGNAYDTQTGVFTAPCKGVYFFTLSCHTDGGIISLGVFRKTLNGTREWMMQVSDNTKDTDHSCTVSRMIHLEKGDGVHVKRYGGHDLQRHNGQTVFSVILVDPLQNLKAHVEGLDDVADSHKVAFSASGGNIRKNDKLVLDGVYVNMGDGYDNSTGIFTAPYEGIYFFTLTCHAFDGNISLLVCKKVDGNVDWMMRVYDNTKDERHSATNSRMIRLEKGDEVYVRPYGGHDLQQHNGQTVFSGFLIEPMQNPEARVDKLDEVGDKPKVAVSVGGGDIKMNDKLVFGHVYVNVGDAYDRMTGVFTANYEGIYFFTLSCFTFEGGIINVGVFRKKMDGISECMMKVSDFTKYKRHGATTSRMMHLEKGDKVYVTPYGNHTLVLHQRKMIFSGFLINPV